MAERGVKLEPGVMQKDGADVLRAYAAAGGVIYGPKG
jgi:hypothetical protein